MTQNSIKPIAFLVHYNKTSNSGNDGNGPLQIASALRIFNQNPLEHFPKSSTVKKFNYPSVIIISDNVVSKDEARGGLDGELNRIENYCNKQEVSPLKIFLSSHYYQGDQSLNHIKNRGFLVFNQTTYALLIALTVRLHNQTNQSFTREELMKILNVHEAQSLVSLYQRVLKTPVDDKGNYLELFDPGEDSIEGEGSKVPLNIILRAISIASDINFDKLTQDLKVEINPTPKSHRV